jgi:hypothetical protein
MPLESPFGNNGLYSPVYSGAHIVYSFR